MQIVTCCVCSEIPVIVLTGMRPSPRRSAQPRTARSLMSTLFLRTTTPHSSTRSVGHVYRHQLSSHPGVTCLAIIESHAPPQIWQPTSPSILQVRPKTLWRSSTPVSPSALPEIWAAHEGVSLWSYDSMPLQL